MSFSGRSSLNNEQRSRQNDRQHKYSIQQINSFIPNQPVTPAVNTDGDYSLVDVANYDSSSNESPKPIFSDEYVDRWDSEHLRMPCSTHNRTRGGRMKWEMICNSLANLQRRCSTPSVSIQDFQETLEEIVHHRCDVSVLNSVLNEYTAYQRTKFLSKTLPGICSLALHVDQICSRPPKLLRAGYTQSVSMSQLQAASLLACSFFSLFPYRSRSTSHSGFEDYPRANFLKLYRTGSTNKSEKLKCILNYFERVIDRTPIGVLTFQRIRHKKCFSNLRAIFSRSKENRVWLRSQTPLVPVCVVTDLKIEDCPNTLQVDFANAYIGGGVLGEGCVQEEIRFSICPEMLVSLLLCQRMRDDECIVLIGCERFSNYRGYADGFKFDGNHNDSTPRDQFGRRLIQVVAIDAEFYKSREIQYQMNHIKRELKKAYVGFRGDTRKSITRQAVTTGHWGCGAFNGDHELKAIIQLMAASEAGRPMIFAAYHDGKFEKRFQQVYSFMMERKWTVGQLYWMLHVFNPRRQLTSIFDFILESSSRKP